MSNLPRRTLLTEVDDSRDNVFCMQAPRFTFALYYRYWFKSSGRGEAGVREVEMQA
jgi:hypothetical protein